MEEITQIRKSDGVVMDYYNKVIMAPMVRVSTLPMRLLARRYGCDIAYSEELIDLKLAKTKRIVNSSLGTIDFISPDKSLTYSTCEEDTFNVLQLGTASASTALAAAMVVANDVCAIDINMGCPKFFSVQGGMGSALLSQPEKIKDILSTLINTFPSLSITCKIRLLKDDNSTIDLLKMIESTGVKAIGVHMREIPERPRDPAHWDRLANILSNASFSVPIIANGDVFKPEDIETVRTQTKANSVMIARGAIRNTSVFKRTTLEPLEVVVPKLLDIAVEFDMKYQNSKYIIGNIVTENEIQKTERGKQVITAKNYETLCKLWGVNYNELVKQKNTEREQKIKSIIKNEQEEKKNVKEEEKKILEEEQEKEDLTGKKHNIDMEENEIESNQPTKRFKEGNGDE